MSKAKAVGNCEELIDKERNIMLFVG